MRAIIYAAGVGARLAEASGGLPKVLLRFGGHSLLERHLRLLAASGITDCVVATGYRADAIAAELDRIGADWVTTCDNPDYRAGSVVTQWAARAALVAGGPVVLMDGDVLYDQRILARLIAAPHADCFLLDRDVDPGEEPAKLCIRDGVLVDFRKNPDQPHDWYGESVGFFKLSAATARALVARTAHYIETGKTGEYYDEALRDLLLAAPPGAFGYEDITGLPWREIDFPEDVAAATAEVLPRLAPLPDAG